MRFGGLAGAFEDVRFGGMVGGEIGLARGNVREPGGSHPLGAGEEQQKTADELLIGPMGNDVGRSTPFILPDKRWLIQRRLSHLAAPALSCRGSPTSGVTPV